jgi:Domain of unknown function (DUF4105)
MKRTFYLLLLLFSFQSPVNAQDSSRLRISLLTCTPGEELYSTFGHSALRVVDSNSVNDIVYNYGTFNFDDEGFYLKFVRGKLLYYVSIQRFDEFKADYQAMNRGITEQVLNFTGDEKISIQHQLNENLKEENRYYKYDFFLDNCTTRLRDMIIRSKQPHPVLPAVMPTSTTFRNAIHQYLDKGQQYWSKLGIDILLGSPTDAIMTTSQQQFLPDNLLKALDSTKNTSMVKSSANLYALDQTASLLGWFSPFVFTSVLLLVFVLLSFSNNRSSQALLIGLDGFLFFVMGILGVLLIFMMTGTDHSMTKSNYNILWAWPTHWLISFFMTSQKKVVKIYFLATAVVLALLLAGWFFLPQQMNNALIPLVLLLLFRSIKRYQYRDIF